MRLRSIRQAMKGSKLVVVSVALAGGVAVIAALSLGSASPSEAAVLTQAEHALSQNGIVHARFLAADGRLLLEEWLKEATNETRRLEHGGPQGGDTITVHSDSRIATWNTINPAATSAVSDVRDPHDPWLLSSSTMLRFKRLLQAGKAQVAGETEVKGKPAWRVPLDTPRSRDAPNDLMVEILLDRETLLPVAMSSTSSGSTESVSIETDEKADGSVPESFFTFDGVPKIRDTRLRYEDLLRPFRKLPVYTLGRAYNGLQVTAPMVEEQRYDAQDPFVFQPHISLGYSAAGLYGDHVIDLTEQPAGTDQAYAELPSYEVPGITRQVIIGGKERTVFILKVDERANTPTAFAVELDGTLVSGRATMSPDDIVAVLSDLQRVN